MLFSLGNIVSSGTAQYWKNFASSPNISVETKALTIDDAASLAEKGLVAIQRV
jgi:hypothetical protein